MPHWPKLGLFLAGFFFGDGLDHAIFIAMGSPSSHYGLRVGTAGQLAFATLDNVALCPIVNRLTYRRTSLSRYRKKFRRLFG
jgi:hypothetical protein